MPYIPKKNLTPEVRSELLRINILISNNIKKLVKAKGWTNSEFSYHLNKEKSRVTELLQGTRCFNIVTLVEISVILNVNITELFKS